MIYHFPLLISIFFFEKTNIVGERKAYQTRKRHIESRSVSDISLTDDSTQFKSTPPPAQIPKKSKKSRFKK